MQQANLDSAGQPIFETALIEPRVGRNIASNGVWTFGYDAENRMLTASKSGVAASYAYDPLGRRTQKSGTGVTQTFFVSDGSDEIAEYNGSGSVTTRYVPGPAIDEPIAMVTASSGAKEFFHTNRQGSVIAMSDGTGAKVEGPFVYDPYGNGAPTTGVAFKYTGRRLDPETGLYYYRARYYWPQGGRFMQIDPVGFAADLNLYAYAGNDPTDKADPSGKVTVVCTIDLTKGTALCITSGDDEKPETYVTYHLQKSTHDKEGNIHKTETTVTETYPADALGVGKDIRAQVNRYLGRNPSFFESVLDHFSAGMAAVRVLQTGGHTISQSTADALGFENRREAGRALERLKRDNNVRNDHQGIIMSNGDYVDSQTGEVIGNIKDYKP
ncbi:MAG: RHS repeat-associated core domain-containing protein [Alphaproteobacteria bacterium]|nr:RHS repeat-associated core domain-containing protein [Alphaproteobacteria bacterium]